MKQLYDPRYKRMERMLKRRFKPSAETFGITGWSKEKSSDWENGVQNPPRAPLWGLISISHVFGIELKRRHLHFYERSWVHKMAPNPFIFKNGRSAREGDHLILWTLRRAFGGVAAAIFYFQLQFQRRVPFHAWDGFYSVKENDCHIIRAAQRKVLLTDLQIYPEIPKLKI